VTIGADHARLRMEKKFRPDAAHHIRVS
jgi:hypothetical protein